MLLHRWFELTNAVLPSKAATNSWPIRFNHCFQRVCLDHVFQQPWRLHVSSPAYKNLTKDQLNQAILVAEGILRQPETLVSLNNQSLKWRGKDK